MAALTPLDIKNKTFSTKMRGYNPEEVNEFLDQVIDDYENSIRRVKELEKSLKHAEEKLTYFNELKDALNQSIIVAQDTADKLKDSASRESDVLLTSAQAEAKSILAEATATADSKVSEATRISNDIVKNAQMEAYRLANETDDLKKKTREFHRSLSLILESQLEIVKGPEWDEILKPFSSYMDDRHTHVKELLSEKEENLEVEASEVHNDEEVTVVTDEKFNEIEEGHTQAIELDELKEEIEKIEEKPKYSRVRRSHD